MEILFSPSTLGFYFRGVNDAIPKDAVEVTEAERSAVLAEVQGSDKVLAADKKGRPIAIVAEPDAEQTMADLRRRRDVYLSKSDKVLVEDFPVSAEERQAWLDYRAELRALPKKYAKNPSKAKWPTPPTPGII